MGDEVHSINGPANVSFIFASSFGPRFSFVMMSSLFIFAVLHMPWILPESSTVGNHLTNITNNTKHD